MRTLKIIFAFAILVQISLGAPVPELDPLPVLSESSTPEDVAIIQLYVYLYGYDHLLTAMNAEIEKILDYLKEINIKFANDPDKLAKYIRVEKVLKEFQTKVNRMYHTCGIMQVLVSYGSETLEVIQYTQDQEFQMVAKRLAELITVENLSDKIEKDTKEVDAFMKTRGKEFVEQTRDKFSELYDQRCNSSVKRSL